MGTPQFPDLGKHCSVDDCKLIDFLPFTCDSCHRVFCLEHRSYGKHHCPNTDRKNVTVVICPLCAKGVRLIPDEDANITWESHVNTECDPSNYDEATKKRKCPVPGCREALTFSNTIRCRDCAIDHCLKHRFGPDHKCSGPRKPESGFSFVSLLSRGRNEDSKSKKAPAPKWASNILNAASTGMAKLSSEFSQALQMGQGSSSSGQVEKCPQCLAEFSNVGALVEHVERIHERGQNRAGPKVTIDACPKCSMGFRDPVSLVEHVERVHGGTSKR